MEKDKIKKEIKIPNALRSGKTTAALLWFFNEGKRGKPVIFKTPEGDFLSPEAVKQALSQQREEIAKKIKKKLLNIRFELVPNTPRKIMIGDKELEKEFDDILTNLTKEQ